MSDIDDKDPLADLKGSTTPPQSAPPKAEAKKVSKLPKAQPAVLAAEPERAPDHVVKRKVTVPWNRTFITLHEGTVVSDRDYGPGGVEKLRNMGVDLEPVA